MNQKMYHPSKKDFKRLSRKGSLIPVYKEILADIDTPVSSFLKLGRSRYSYLLESVEGGEKVGRYSFLGSEPSLVFKSKGRCVEIIESRKRNKFITQKDPIYEIKKIMDNFKFVPVEGLPRFSGGLVGYMAYDMVRFFEKIPEVNPDDLNLPDAIFILTDSIVIFDHLEHKIKIVSNVFINDHSDLDQLYLEAIKKIEKISWRLERKNISYTDRIKGDVKAFPSKKLRFKSNLSEKRFKEIVRKAKRYIRAGDIIQVVLSQRLEVELDALEPFLIYRSLRSINPSPYMYYLNFEDLIMVGSSPEVMVRCEDRVVELRPIAGTRPRHKDLAKDKLLEQELINDPKEKAEHIMLVDLGRNDIGRVCDYHTVKVPELMTIERYSHVMHIVSDVVGRLKKGKDIYELMRACFPAGTVTGAPKVRAMEIIEELENIKRGPYAGSIGYFSFSGNLDSCITIRTILIYAKRAYVQVGAGIVADSKPYREYRETINKAMALLKAIYLAKEYAKANSK